MKLQLTTEQCDQIVAIIKKHQHLEYGNNYAPKMVIDSVGMGEIEQELRRTVKKK